MTTTQSTGIRVELTATRRAALHRYDVSDNAQSQLTPLVSYTFPEGTVNPRLLVDIANDGQQSSTRPIMTLNSTTARVIGQAYP